MKSNIQRINYEGDLDPNGKWWRWDEFCDRCGSDCGKSAWQTMTEPNTQEKDYCLKCLRELLRSKMIGGINNDSV